MTDTPFLRSVRLSQDIAGELWLGPMPGRLRPFINDLDALQTQRIDRIINLAPIAEIEKKAPDYAAALAENVGISIVRFPVADFGIPADETSFFLLAERTAADLRSGNRIFVHCAAGIGRTGTMAICVLLALGLGAGAATKLVANAGSGPETEGQKALVARCARLPQSQSSETSA
ncbi:MULTISPECIES: protein-tyrosine phosphatase family protein [unclassified Rhizobium]|uniref:protein-tyrosine phosphatase family protein n=1 Tax=unclassified Rhizobium TaxID=2613769 RepID=UPI0038300F38